MRQRKIISTTDETHDKISFANVLKIDDLVKEVENLKETNEDLATHNNSYLQQVAELEANLIEQVRDALVLL